LIPIWADASVHLCGDESAYFLCFRASPSAPFEMVWVGLLASFGLTVWFAAWRIFTAGIVLWLFIMVAENLTRKPGARAGI